jgi:transcriptional regulator with XRE-family HTH domain
MPEATDPAWQAYVRAVGAALAAERRKAGLSQQQVAEQIGVEPESVSRMETGSIVPSLLRLRQLAGVYGCSMESLVGRTSDQAPDISKWLARELDGLGDADRAFVTQQTEHLIGHLKASAKRRK